MWPQEANSLKTRIYFLFIFLVFFKPIRVENLKQIRNPRVFYCFNFSNIFNLHLRPERLKTLLWTKPGACPRHSGGRGRLPKAFKEEGAAIQGLPGGAAAQGTPEEGGREGGREADHVATRGQFFKNPSVFLIFQLFSSRFGLKILSKLETLVFF